MRKFESGATRDTDQGKLDYIKALSPIVLRRYVQYLDKHRLQSDGSYRDFDNWKKGIPQETYLSSLGRHFVDIWLIAHGYPTSDNHGPVVDQDVLCAILFNTMGLLHKMLEVQFKEDKDYDDATEHYFGPADDERGSHDCCPECKKKRDRDVAFAPLPSDNTTLIPLDRTTPISEGY